MSRFLVNPASGGGRARRFLPRLRRRAAALGAEVEVSSGGEDLTDRARRAVTDGVGRLVVAGGDGSLHLVVQALAETECELAILPCGRGNDLAKSLGIPGRFDAALDLALGGAARPIDLGRAGDRWFHCYGGAGFDAEVSRTADRHPRWWPDTLTYVVAVVRTLVGFRPPRVRVSWDGGVFEGEVMFVTACNAPYFGGGMNIAPGAEMTDGMLDLVVVRRVSKPALLKVFPRVYRGTHVGHPAVEVHRARRVALAFDPPALLGCDGEPVAEVGEEELTVEVRPGALRVVTPARA